MHNVAPGSEAGGGATPNRCGCGCMCRRVAFWKWPRYTAAVAVRHVPDRPYAAPTPPTGGLWLREIKHDTARTAGGAQGHAGVITPLETSPWAAAFAKRLHELGWIEGRN